ncbi:MAG: Gx transporter family protein [Clostridiales bacterium]|nr:Gx transporter family protein [Clostridiales bacterium]
MKKKYVTLGFLLAASMILAYIESLIPFTIGIPGIKLGLPNMAVVLLLYTYGYKEALSVNLLRILLTGFLFGNMYSIIYALAGALCSFLLMLLFKKISAFSVIGVSIIGGVAHNIGQTLVAMIVVENFAPLFYLPILLIAGIVTGFLIGVVSMRVMGYLKRMV